MLTTTKKSTDVVFQNKLHYLAKNLRKNPTAAEATLWQYLRHKQLVGYKFRRQYPIYGFIVDFYCHEKKLIIEVDGLIHNQQQNRDHGRDIILQQHGYTTLRFTNKEIFDDISSIIKKIQGALISV